MRNKLLRTIFHGTNRGDSGRGLQLIGIPKVHSATETAGPVTNAHNAISGAFSTLLQTQDSNATAQPIGAIGAADNQLTELFGTVSKNLDQLRSVTDKQTTVLGANTDALTNNTAAKSITQVASAATSTVGGFLGGLTALPLISGLFSLFGGGASSKQQQPLPKYNAPPKLDFNESLKPGTGGGSTQSVGFDQSGYSRIPIPDANHLPNYASILKSAANNTSAGGTYTPSSPDSNFTDNQSTSTNSSTTNNHVTVTVQAMDSQSFMDRSHDIAQAVREAMLNMHPINDVVNDL